MMDRRAFLKAMSAMAVAAAAPAVSLAEENPRVWVYKLHNVEVVDGAFGEVVRGIATLVDRPDVSLWWAHKVDRRHVGEFGEPIGGFPEEVDTILQTRFTEMLYVT